MNTQTNSAGAKSLSPARKRMIALVVVMFTVLFCVFLTDFALKVLKLPKESRRIMLLSGGMLSTDENGVRRYEPSKSLEQAAYINGKLAYRYPYRSNNLGFISPYDFNPGEKLDLMIVGDSVTEGQEVGPWMNEFQRVLLEKYKKSSQNMAIAGNGFVEFEKAALYAKKSLGARKAMIVFIADDMFRPGDVMVANEKCSTYKNFTGNEINCFSGRPTWQAYDKKLSDAELVAYADSLQQFGLFRTLRRPMIDFAKSSVSYFCKLGIRLPSSNAMILRINKECDAIDQVEAQKKAKGNAQSDTKSYFFTIAHAEDTAVPSGPAVPPYTIQAYKNILQTYGSDNVLMLMIPGGTLRFKDLRPDLFFKKEFAKDFPTGLNFVNISESCDMPYTLYSEGGGGHPTKEGYLKLQSCVLEAKEVFDFVNR